jgi:regulator of sirC expression with transglutaminase-like and TPR domain
MDKSHDGSIDPLSQSSMHWSQERLSADVHRAVGGCLNLIREVSRLSNELDPEMPTDWMIKRTQFFAYELVSILPEGLDERARLAFLNRFLFDSKCFKCITEMATLTRPSDAFRMSRVLAARAGAPMMLALIYAYLAERIDVALEFVDFNPAWFLRWNDGGRSRYIDVTRAGATLSIDELIEVMQTRYAVTADTKGLLEPLTFERFVIAYITDLKSTLLGIDREPEKLLFLQNALIVYQPSNLQLLAERAVLHRKLGNFKSALADLKRYFAFHERERAPSDVCRLHDELVVLLDRTPRDQ